MNIQDKISTLHEEASELKRLAITDTHINLYKQASEKYRELSNLIGEAIKHNVPGLDFIVAVQSQFYYSYECELCLYAYYFRIDQYEDAIEHAREAKKITQEWLISILPKLRAKQLQKKDLDQLDNYEKQWKISDLGMESKIIEPQVKIKELEGKFFEAWDLRKRMLKKQKVVYEYAEREEMEEHFIRTAKANFFALTANVAHGAIKILNEKIENKRAIHNITSQLFRSLLEAYENANKAFETNPEQEEYSQGASLLYTEISNLLNTKKVDWYDLIVQFQDNSNALKIMERIDKNKFNAVKSQRAGFERKLAIAFGCLGLSLFLIVAIFYPCPTNFQYIVFRIFIAIAAGAAAMMITGSIGFNNPLVKASGAIAMTLVVYYSNPAQIAINDDCFGNESKVEGIITIKGRAAINFSIVNIESEVSRQTNSLGKFEMSIPKSKFTDDNLTFQIQGTKIDTMINIVPSKVDLKKLNIRL